MKKLKIIHILVIFLLTLSIGCDLYTINLKKDKDSSETNLLFTESFDTTLLDQIPDEFYTRNGDENTYVGVVDDTEIIPHSLPNCLKLSDNSNPGSAEILRNIGNQYYGQLTYYLYVDNTSPWAGTFIGDIIQLFFNSNRDITITLPNGTLQTIGTYTTDTWHKVEINWDAYTYRYKVFFNDSDLGTYTFKIDQIPSEIGLAVTQGLDTGHLNYVDDVTFTMNPESIN